MDRKIKHIIAENPFLTLEEIPNYFYCIIKTFSVSCLLLQRYGDLVGWQREIL